MTAKRLLAAAAAIAVCSAGCGSASGSAGPPSASPSTAAPSAGSPDRLATVTAIDWLSFPDTGQFDVTFHLTEHCAYLQGPPDKPVLLVWPDGQAWIDPATPDSVQLREPGSGKLVRISDGQRVNLGGMPYSGDTYTTPPHPSCPADEAFLVAQIM
ncbi:hypothetical protein OHA21_31150 [Actinoplanes sp. NBC_00393]|uniref:hypothetical protein n=1 Tax=Actinoplanes sp. NBC_00393 TaxID=2975953 RepID=UPI002E1B9DBB